jgi:hypothetical protein
MPRLETQNRPPAPETENRRPFSPEAARMIVGAVVPSIIHPENKLKPEQKQEFIARISTITPEQIPAKQIADLSGESRRQNHQTYETWSGRVKQWFDGKDGVDKQQLQKTFTSLGINVSEEMGQEQINQFFDTYLSMSGTKEDYQRRYTSFVQKIVGEFVTEGTLDHQALNTRMTLLRPLLSSFGETDIVTLVDAHIQSVGYISQKEEVRTQQANEILTAAELPFATDNSINGFIKLAEKSAIRTETPPSPEDDDDAELSPELAATDQERFKELLFEKLGDLTMHTKKAWELAEEKGWVTKDELTIQSDTWDSHSDAHRGIQLGTAVLPENVTNPIFGSDHFSYEDEIAFRLTHELAHKIDPTVLANDQQLESLLNFAKRVRASNPDTGLTVLPHNEHYKQKGPEVQAHEDLIELATMYLFDASYFKQYLLFLSEDEYAQQREALHLVSLSSDNANAVLAIFNNVLGQKFLGLPPAEPEDTTEPSDEEQKQRAIEVLQRLLTPDMARSNPEGFKKMLLENLHLYSKFGQEAFVYALQKGIVTLEDIQIDPSTWNSSSDSTTGIVLGTADFPVEQSENIVFENKRFNYQEQVAYRLIHELCHKLNYATFQHDPAFSGLMQKTQISREQTGQGFSALGSQFNYESQGREVQGREDLVEMVNMYLIDPAYLQRFLQFLVNENPEDEATRQALKLRKIDLPVANTILNTIDQAVQKGLSGQLEPAEPVAA